MPTYEYRLVVVNEPAAEIEQSINELANDGWRVTHTLAGPESPVILLEREVRPGAIGNIR
jgi:hypothetical protein